MKLIEHIRKRSFFERSFHALSYEVIGIITSAPIISFFTGKPVAESGILAIIISIIAMVWNYVFNVLFDKLQHKYQFEKTLFVRTLHGVSFEVGLVLISVPIIALLFRMQLLEAFLLELGMLLYFFPYTIVFNWCYDKVRMALLKRYDHQQSSTLSENN